MYKKIYIEISNVCNLQCSFCPEVERDKNYLGPDEFEKIIHEVAPLTERVCLHLMGEPLAHPEFDELLLLCEKYNVPIELTTNGLLIKSKSKQLMSFKGLKQINFSVQSFLDNFPNKDVTGYLNSLLEFSKIMMEFRPEVYINFRLWNIDRDEHSHPHNEIIFCALEKYFGVNINRTIQVNAIKSKNILNRFYLHFDSHFEWPSLDYAFQSEQGRCHGLSNHFGILADGTVVPCCLDKEGVINLGNVLENEIHAILGSSRAQKIREGFSHNKRVESLCQHCSYINRF